MSGQGKETVRFSDDEELVRVDECHPVVFVTVFNNTAPIDSRPGLIACILANRDKASLHVVPQLVR